MITVVRVYGPEIRMEFAIAAPAPALGDLLRVGPVRLEPRQMEGCYGSRGEFVAITADATRAQCMAILAWRGLVALWPARKRARAGA